MPSWSGTRTTWPSISSTTGPGPEFAAGSLIVAGVSIAAGLALSIEPTWGKFHILRLKKTATLSGLLGDWIRMRHIYAIYILFLAAVSLRYAWAVFRAIRKGAPEPLEHATGRLDE